MLAETFREIKSKLNTYNLKEIFSYTGVSKLNIARNLLTLGFLSILGRRHVMADVNDYRMKLDLKTPGLSKVLFVYGTRELPDTFVAYEIIKPGMVVADIGANIGYYALLEAKRVGETGQVYAFEPDPRNIPLLRENVRLNNMDGIVTIYEKAVSDKNERKSFQLGERSNVSSFVDRPDVVGAVMVDCVALSDFDHMASVDMLRMDAEGYECKIIEGALPFLKSNRKPFIIMLEVHPKEYNDSDLNFKQTLKDLFEINFKVTHFITSTKHRDHFSSRGHVPAGTWVETRYGRDLYLDMDKEIVFEALQKDMIRSMVLTRK